VLLFHDLACGLAFSLDLGLVDFSLFALVGIPIPQLELTLKCQFYQVSVLMLKHISNPGILYFVKLFITDCHKLLSVLSGIRRQLLHQPLALLLPLHQLISKRDQPLDLLQRNLKPLFTPVSFLVGKLLQVLPQVSLINEIQI